MEINMYKNCSLILFLSMMITGMCMLTVREVDLNRKLSDDIFHMTLQQACEAVREKEEEPAIFHFGEILEIISSPKRTVNYNILVDEDAVLLSEEDYEILCRIVEAEAGTEDEKGRMLVARVVLNRVESSRFPDTVKGVVFQKEGGVCQFSPIADGRYYNVSVSEDTREAVQKVLKGKDESQGALYFVNRGAANTEYMYWFDTKCTPLFSYGRHEFFS